MGALFGISLIYLFSILSADAGTVYKTIIKNGTGPVPQPNQTVVVHYTGKLQSGVQFDSSRDRNEPFKFRLGAGEVISGWDAGVGSMQVGERVELEISPEDGYGAEGYPPVIPPSATLLFDIELLAIEGVTPMPPQPAFGLNDAISTSPGASQPDMGSELQNLNFGSSNMFDGQGFSPSSMGSERMPTFSGSSTEFSSPSSRTSSSGMSNDISSIGGPSGSGFGNMEMPMMPGMSSVGGSRPEFDFPSTESRPGSSMSPDTFSSSGAGRDSGRFPSASMDGSFDFGGSRTGASMFGQAGVSSGPMSDSFPSRQTPSTERGFDGAGLDLFSGQTGFAMDSRSRDMGRGSQMPGTDRFPEARVPGMDIRRAGQDFSRSGLDFGGSSFDGMSFNDRSGSFRSSASSGRSESRSPSPDLGSDRFNGGRSFSGSNMFSGMDRGMRPDFGGASSSSSDFSGMNGMSMSGTNGFPSDRMSEFDRGQSMNGLPSGIGGGTTEPDMSRGMDMGTGMGMGAGMGMGSGMGRGSDIGMDQGMSMRGLGAGMGPTGAGGREMGFGGGMSRMGSAGRMGTGMDMSRAGLRSPMGGTGFDRTRLGPGGMPPFMRGSGFRPGMGPAMPGMGPGMGSAMPGMRPGFPGMGPGMPGMGPRPGPMSGPGPMIGPMGGPRPMGGPMGPGMMPFMRPGMTPFGGMRRGGMRRFRRR